MARGVGARGALGRCVSRSNVQPRRILINLRSGSGSRSSCILELSAPSRSRSQPYGRSHLTAHMFQKVNCGNSQNAWVRSLVEIALKMQMVYWVENPDSSCFWNLAGWEDELLPPSVKIFRIDVCHFGTLWRKRTRVDTNCTPSHLPGSYAAGVVSTCVWSATQGSIAAVGPGPRKLIRLACAACWGTACHTHPDGRSIARLVGLQVG